MKNSTVAIAVLGVIILTLVVFLLQRPQTLQNLTPLPTPTTLPNNEGTPSATQTPIKQITVEGSEFRFEPNIIRVKQGDRVQINFKNEGRATHNLTIDQLNLATKNLNTDESDLLEFTVEKKGTFKIFCSIGDHEARGMVGQLIVE